MAVLPGQRILLPKLCSKICNQTWPEEWGGGGGAGRDGKRDRAPGPTAGARASWMAGEGPDGHFTYCG